jgi:hypothetical protein
MGESKNSKRNPRLVVHAAHGSGGLTATATFVAVVIPAGKALLRRQEQITNE